MDSPQTVHSTLQKNNKIIERDVKPVSAFDRFKLWALVRLSHTEKLMFTKYLSVLLQSGLAIDEVLGILLDQSKGAIKHIASSLRNSVKQGGTLSQGFAQYPHLFSPVYINLVGAGEASGTLLVNLEHLVDQMQRDHDLRQKIRGAIMYPTVILCAAIALSVGIVVFILPNITDVFASLNIELPITTRILLWIADLMRFHGTAVALSLISFVVFCFVIRKIPLAKPIIHETLLHLPLFGPLAKKTNLARLTRLLGTMLKGGMPIDEALPIAVSVLNNVRYKTFLTGLEHDVDQGQTLAEAFSKAPRLFPGLLVRMTRVGEESGTLGDTFLYLASFFEEEINDATKNLSTLLEPILLVGIGLMVGTVALSIIAPIYEVVGKI